ncbi:MAG: hypothetical protein IPP15_00340 [Saprospiraceae bacterium]|uniref:Uncharacterized protein n=1 Tax=Candidatus Opimibacter skivensis TaxID=2982028 RepID=A0A9D7SPU7_9BACT|nr:hypothetical protein [Candidatus Opimibacter skivensis]
MQNYHVVKSTKSVGIGILLTLLLGPIGLFYSTVWGGIIMTCGPILVVGISVLGLFTDIEIIQAVGLVTLLTYFLFWWLICIIWSAIAVKQYNKKIMNQSNYNISYYPVNPTTESPSYLENRTKQLAFRDSNQLPLKNLNNDVPNIQDWLKANPNKGVNDYYIKFRK